MYTSMYIHMYMCVYVSEGSEFDRYTLFFVLWALKEAYIKAVGIGLGYDLKQVPTAVVYVYALVVYMND